MIGEGETAPDFELEGVQEGEIRAIRLSEYAADRPTVLAFYVYDFSPVCTEQLCEMSDMEILSLNDDIGVLGVSTDSPWSHRRFAAENDITYPLLSDPHMDIYEQHGLTESDGGRPAPKRGIVVLDADRVVQYKWVADDNWDPWTLAPLDGVKETIRGLKAR